MAALIACERPAGPVVPPRPAAPVDPPATWLGRAEPHRWSLVLDPEAARSLRANPRGYVRATLVEHDGAVHEGVWIKVKGGEGSYRPFDDRPSLTLNADRTPGPRRIQGLDKWHLNNSLQDPSYAREALCAELARQAGVPAPRVGYVLLRLDGRDRGLYVLKEGFDRAFLSRHFADPTGNLYDAGLREDIDAPLERDEGAGPGDRRDLRALLGACQEPDPVRRRAVLAQHLDLDAFLAFAAFERLVGHWDGYTEHANNYRLYVHPADGRARFLPHGMDQTFQDPAHPIHGTPPSWVGWAVLSDPKLRERYRQVLRRLRPLFDADRLADWLERHAAAVAPALGPRAAEQRAASRQLAQLLVRRAAFLDAQLDAPDPPVLTFDERGVAELATWLPVVETRAELASGPEGWTIAAAPPSYCVASWRCAVGLDRGRYRVEAHLEADGVAGADWEGAVLRADRGPGTTPLTGTRQQVVALVVPVERPGRTVLFAVELRAAHGRIALRRVRVVRLD